MLKMKENAAGVEAGWDSVCRRAVAPLSVRVQITNYKQSLRVDTLPTSSFGLFSHNISTRH